MGTFAYIRSCCGQSHDGPMCRDGLVRCCLCFDRFPIDALNTVDLDGSTMNLPEDVCAECATSERTLVFLHGLAVLFPNLTLEVN